MDLELTDANFEAEVLKSDIPVFVDFWAPWCGPCNMMGSFVDELTKEYEGKAGKIKIGKLNVDENAGIAEKYNIMSVPAFMVFKGGEPMETVSGGVQKEKLKEMMEKYA